jgi:antirestriction protein
MKKELLEVFVTNLGKYNEGELVGKWLSLPCTEEELEATFKEIGINEMYEEYFITDYSSDYGLTCEEYTNLHRLNEQMQELEDNCDDYDKLEACIEYTGDLEEALEMATNDNVYFMAGVTAEEYLQDQIEMSYDLNFEKLGWLSTYVTIDYEAMARDNYNLHETTNGVIEDCR